MPRQAVAGELSLITHSTRPGEQEALANLETMTFWTPRRKLTRRSIGAYKDMTLSSTANNAGALARNVRRNGHLDLAGAGQVIVQGRYAYVGHIPNRAQLDQTPSTAFVTFLT